MEESLIKLKTTKIPKPPDNVPIYLQQRLLPKKYGPRFFVDKMTSKTSKQKLSNRKIKMFARKWMKCDLGK